MPKGTLSVSRPLPTKAADHDITQWIQHHDEGTPLCLPVMLLNEATMESSPGTGR